MRLFSLREYLFSTKEYYCSVQRVLVHNKEILFTLDLEQLLAWSSLGPGLDWKQIGVEINWTGNELDWKQNWTGYNTGLDTTLDWIQYWTGYNTGLELDHP